MEIEKKMTSILKKSLLIYVFYQIFKIFPLSVKLTFKNG